MTPDLRAVPPRAARQASAREFLSVVFRRRWVILGLFIITTATVLVATLGTPTTYRSTGKVLVKRGERESLLAPYRTFTAWEEALASEVQFIQSQPVIDRAQQLLEERARKGGPHLRVRSGQVDAEVVGASNAVTIAYSERDPEHAQIVCDAIIRGYIEVRSETFNLSYPKRFFDSAIDSVRIELAHWEALRRNFSQGTGTVDISEQQRSSIGYRAVLEEKRNVIASDLAEARMQLSQWEALAESHGLDIPMTGQGNEQVLVDLKLRVTTQEARLAQLREKYRDDSPDVVNAQATLDTLRSLLERESRARVRYAAAHVELLEARLKPVDAELARVRGDLSTMPAKAMTLGEMDHQIAVLRARSEELVKSADQARITQQTTSDVNIMLLMPAGPGRATNARDYVRLALAPAFSLVVGLGLAFFIDGLDTRVRTASDAEVAADLPVLASLRERRRRSDDDPDEEALTR